MKRLRIPTSLDIQRLLDRVPAEFDGFKIDKVYFVCDAIYKSSLRLDENTHTHPQKKERYYVPLQSEILSHYLGTAYYHKIINWMVATEIIEVDGTYENNIVCLGYRFTERYRLDKSKRVDVSDFKMYTKKKYEPKETKKGFKASRTVTRLKKWYDGLTINVQGAIDTIAHQYNNDLIEANTAKKFEKAVARFNSSHTALDAFGGDMADYQFQDPNGRRLHTALTSLPKHLRRHVRYKGQELAQTDLSNSQLYFTTMLFEAKNWTKNRKNQTKQLWDGLEYVPSSSYSIMSCESSETQYSKGFQSDKFMQLVCSGTIYDHFVARMEQHEGFFKPNLTYAQKRKKVKLLLIAQINGDASVIDGSPKIYNFKAIGVEPTRKQRTKKKQLKNLRLYTGKNLLLWLAFCEDFPEVADIYRRIKLYNNADLSHVLQRIESTGVLEFACHEIGKELPEAPLFTLHDCLVTTVEYIGRVDAIFKSALTRYIGHTPQTEIKKWSEYEEVLPLYIEDWDEAA